MATRSEIYQQCTYTGVHFYSCKVATLKAYAKANNIEIDQDCNTKAKLIFKIIKYLKIRRENEDEDDN